MSQQKQQKSLSKLPPLTLKLRSSSPKVEQAYKNFNLKMRGVYPEKIPKNFDSRLVWGLNQPGNQGSCGSCWSFATTACLADRILAFTGKKIQLSPTFPVLCDFLGKEVLDEADKTDANKEMYNSGVGACSGNTLPESFGFLYRRGTCLLDCAPYDTKISLAQESKELPLCQEFFGKGMDKCSDGSPIKMFRGIQVYRVGGTKQDNGSERDIREDIFCYGPVATGLAVYSDFQDYYKTADPTTVYKHESGDLMGGHAVEIVGWGEAKMQPTDNKETKFWIVRNSWGNDVGGDGGYFKILRGENECEIEANVFSIIPDVPNVEIVKYYPSVYGERDKELRDQFPVLPSGIPQNTAESLGLTKAPPFFPGGRNYQHFKAVLTGDLSQIGKIKDLDFPVDPADTALIQELKTTGGKNPLTEKKLSVAGKLLSATAGTGGVSGGTTSTTSYVWMYFLIPLVLIILIIIGLNYFTKRGRK
jgi:Papain family cysteine protease